MARITIWARTELGAGTDQVVTMGAILLRTERLLGMDKIVLGDNGERGDGRLGMGGRLRVRRGI